MLKVIALLFTILLTLASVGGYLFLDDKIIAGEKLLAAGQGELEKAQPKFDADKARLERGKQELSAGKKEYEHAQDNKLLVLVDNAFNGGKGFEEGREKIAEGDQRVAKGEGMINAGEKKIDEGKLALSRGMNQLNQAREARNACAAGAILFATLSIGLGLLWRKTLAMIFMHTNT